MSNSRFSEFNLDPALAEAVESAPDHQVIEGIIRLDDPEQIPPEFRVVCQFIRVCTGRFLAEQAWNIRQHPNVISLKAARPLGILDHDANVGVAPPTTIAFRTRQSLPFSGRGSIVAALDFGLDFGHPNFLNPDGTTRVMSFWHQGAPYDPAHPNQYGYGRVFSPDEINVALRTPDPYQTLGYHPAISDTGKGSHGTHTLDIAAGNGRARGSLSGIARDADLLFVHLSTPRLGVVGDLGDSVRMLEALDFVHKTAGDRPCAVNISVGREAGSHDATSPFEQAMHELLRMGNAVNRAICQSGGNYGSADLATNGWLRDGEQRDLEWIVHANDVSPQIDAWYSGNDRFLAVLLPPDGGAAIEVKLGKVGDIRRDGDLIGRIYHRRNDPNNRDNHIEVFLYQGAPSGVWILRLIGEYVITGRFHAWIERAIPGAQSHFDKKITSSMYTLGTIATSPLVITVGAYDANADGGPLAFFSSCGPTRDERQDKPELLAPGVEVVAARSIPGDAAAQEGLLMARSGTSMATPHVTGCVAAMFEAAGRPLSISEIRDCLKKTAQPIIDAERPNCCAWGRLNIEEAIRRTALLQASAFSTRSEPNDVGSDASIITPETAVYEDIGDTATGLAEHEKPPVEQEVAEAAPIARIASPGQEGVPMNSNGTHCCLDRAEQARRCSYGGRCESEIAFLHELLRQVDGSVSSRRVTPASLFSAIMRNKPTSKDFDGLFQILGTPLRRPNDALRPGDWMIRSIVGTGDVGHVMVLTSDPLTQPMLVAEGIDAESSESGHFGVVIEAGAYPHGRSQPFARRVLDSSGRVPQQTVILRPRQTSQITVADAPDELVESSLSSAASGSACSVWLPSVASTNYRDWIAAPTQGRLSLLINGRDSNGGGPDVDLAEPLREMETSVKALGSGDFCYLSAWFFEPDTSLTAGTYLGETSWGGLFRKKAEEGVNIRILLNDFDPFTKMDSWERVKSLTPLEATVRALPLSSRMRLIYVVSRHPANYAGVRAAAIRALSGGGSGPIFIGSHHQKFMVVRNGGATTAYCGGLDIESRKTPSNWSYAGLLGWHDLTLKLEGPITRDLERQFVERWNREQSSAQNPLLPGWSSWGTLSLPPSLAAADETPAKKVQNVQATRTVSSDATSAAYATDRNDIRVAYGKIISCASSFLYLENQYFRDLSLADEIAARGRRMPGLIAIFVVLADATGDDGKNPLTFHGSYLQHEFFSRVTAGLGSRVGIYTMYGRSVHAKMLMADDHVMSIGSANANVRSFELDSEMNLTIDDRDWLHSARLKLWGHNLGLSQSAVRSWAVADFLTKWNSVAIANAAVMAHPDRMVGEGVIVYDWAANRGSSSALVPDYLVQLDIAPAPNKIYGFPSSQDLPEKRRAIA